MAGDTGLGDGSEAITFVKTAGREIIALSGRQYPESRTRQMEHLTLGGKHQSIAKGVAASDEADRLRACSSSGRAGIQIEEAVAKRHQVIGLLGRRYGRGCSLSGTVAQTSDEGVAD